MPLPVPTTQEIVDQNVTNLESNLNQTTPATPKAFNRVLGTTEAMNATGLYRFGAERAKQNLALTANEAGLTVLGNEYKKPRKAAVAAQLNIQVAADPATSLPITAQLTGDPNSEKYHPNATYVESGGVIDAVVTAETTGIAGNLVATDTMTLDEPIAGVGSTWTVQSVAVLGLDQEDIEAWRRRILLAIQTTGGGGNGVDYREWAEETVGCFRAFPYAGAPVFTVVGLLDGDMEAVGVGDWTPGNSAVLTKETASPKEGSRNLRITQTSPTQDPFAEQDAVLIDRRYRITGWARGNGSSGIPTIKNELTGGAIFAGTPSTTWQEIDAEFWASLGTSMIFMADTNVSIGSPFVEFDDIDIVQISFPGDRSVFVEAETTIDPDGIAPQSLLDDVRVSINTDPVTGKARPGLGDTDENLYVQSIRRTTLNVEIRDLVVDADIETATKASISTAVDEYLRGISPFIQGTDPPATQNDLITDLTLSQVIQDILNPVGGSASGVGLYFIINQFIPSYILGQGELTKLGVINYV